MQIRMSRRALLQTAATAALPSLTPRAAAAQTAAPRPVIPDHFPGGPPELAREVVWVAHFDEKRLRELVDARPALARASWDWGFGDWESALGAASHMANRPIAQYLIGKGARPTIFSAVMLGQLDVVKAFVAADPGVAAIRGPHGISLLGHARMGGAAARPVYDFLQSLESVDDPAPAPLTDAEASALVGTYVFGISTTAQIEVDADMKSYLGGKAYAHPPQLNWTRRGSVGRPLFHVGDNTFYPAGAPSVKIRFAREGNDMVLTVHDPDLALTARRKAT